LGDSDTSEPRYGKSETYAVNSGYYYFDGKGKGVNKWTQRFLAADGTPRNEVRDLAYHPADPVPI
jgi:hypothetical protein